MACHPILRHPRTMDPHPMMMMEIILRIPRVAKKMVKKVLVRRIQMKTGN